MWGDTGSPPALTSELHGPTSLVVIASLPQRGRLRNSSGSAKHAKYPTLCLATGTAKLVYCGCFYFPCLKPPTQHNASHNEGKQQMLVEFRWLKTGLNYKTLREENVCFSPIPIYTSHQEKGLPRASRPARWLSSKHACCRV